MPEDKLPTTELKKKPKIKIIGLHGAAGAGKDTAAEAFTNYDKTTKILAFARPLKDACQTLFNLTDNQLYDPKEKEEIIRNADGSAAWCIDGKEASPRLFFQWLGTDIIRNHVTNNFFVENMRQRIEKIIESLIPGNSPNLSTESLIPGNSPNLSTESLIPGNSPNLSSKMIVITDVRLPNEANFIRSLGGTIVKIERPSVGTLTKLTQHETEKGIPSELVDHVVVNDGTIEELHKKMEYFCKR
jgi:hypothetical protein